MVAPLSCSLALALALAACGSAPHVRSRGTLAARTAPIATGCELGDEPRLCLLARVTGERVEVTLELDPEALPASREDVRLVFAEGLEVELVEGSTELGALEERTSIAYRVELGDEPLGSFRRPGGWHLTGRSFVPEVWVDGARAEVPSTLRLETEGEPLFTAAGAPRLFDAESTIRLAGEAYEIGRLRTVRREVGSTVLVVGTSGDEPLDAVADVLARALRSLAARLGPAPVDAVLVAFHRREEALSERLGASIVQASAEGVPSDPVFGTASAAMRELGRLWIPGVHEVSEPWLRDGVPDYLAMVTAAHVLAMRSAPAQLVMRAHRDTRDTHHTGLVASFCLDSQLRESGSTLGAALRTTLAREERVLGAEALLEDLAAISPASAGHLAAVLASEETIAVDDCLERAGVRAREVSFEGWSDDALRMALGAETLRAARLALGIVVESIREGSLLEAGDVLTDVRGTRVGDLDELAWALRDVSAGERVRLVLRRRGEPLALELTFPELDADREPRAIVEIAPVD